MCLITRCNRSEVSTLFMYAAQELVLQHISVNIHSILLLHGLESKIPRELHITEPTHSWRTRHK